MSSPSVLVIVASPRLSSLELGLVREHAQAGARVVAWQHPPIVQERFPSPDVAAALEEHGLNAQPLSKALGEDVSIEVDEAVIAWMKAFGRAPIGYGGESFRELFRYRQLSLWWWAELFLYHDTPLRLLVRDIEALARLVELDRPQRLVLIAPVRELARAVKILSGISEVRGSSRPTRSRFSHLPLRFAGGLLKMLGTGAKGVFRSKRTVPRVEGRKRWLFLTHAAMWRERTDPETGRPNLVEMYFDPIPSELAAAGDDVRLVAVGPPVPFKQRGLRATVEDVLELRAKERPYVSIRRYVNPRLVFTLMGAYLGCWRMWQEFRSLPGLAKALSHRGVPFRESALESFRDTFLLQIPWAIRSFHELESVLVRENPDALALYAESSGLGRAAVAACEAHGVPSFAVQHGIMYPRYYSHEHAPDEVGLRTDGGDSVPLPTRTAVFGSLAKDLLVSRGHYPPQRIVITGSPKFDALLETAGRFDRSLTRERLAIPEGARMLVAASRYSAMGPVFEELVRAVEEIPDLILLVKPHQAESAEPYAIDVRKVGASRVQIAVGTENLLELLVASDGLVTVDSLASSEALVVGRPVLVVNLPSNLGPLVERGVALGVRQGEAIVDKLRQMLFDEERALELERRRKDYIREFAFGADGGSTRRMVEALRETALLRRISS